MAEAQTLPAPPPGKPPSGEWDKFADASVALRAAKDEMIRLELAEKEVAKDLAQARQTWTQARAKFEVSAEALGNAAANA